MVSMQRKSAVYARISALLAVKNAKSMHNMEWSIAGSAQKPACAVLKNAAAWSVPPPSFVFVLFPKEMSVPLIFFPSDLRIIVMKKYLFLLSVLVLHFDILQAQH